MKTKLVYCLGRCRDFSKDQDLGRKVTSSSGNVTSMKYKNVCLFKVLFVSPPIVCINYLVCINYSVRRHLGSKRISTWQDNAFLFFLCLFMNYSSFYFQNEGRENCYFAQVSIKFTKVFKCLSDSAFAHKKLYSMQLILTMPKRENVMVLFHES